MNKKESEEKIENTDYDYIAEYGYASWKDIIKNLSSEELQERIDSDEWQDEYKALCKKEIEKRK